MSYPAVVQQVKDLMARPPLCGHDDAWLHTSVLRRGLSEAPAMGAELLDFRRAECGRQCELCRGTGADDDLVLAAAIGSWFLNQPPPPRAWVASY